jgi:acyl-phosphate glycerol 3-phosphate acyltransferase
MSVNYFILIFVGVVSYLIGNISPAILIGRLHGIDIRSEGSGNAGTTNVLRVLGAKAALATLAIDVFKGFLAVRISLGLDAGDYGSMIAFACVVLGHIYPALYKFRGGKGVATSLGAALALNWPSAFALILIAILVVGFTKKMSLGSILAAIAYPFLIWFYYPAALPVAVAMALLVIVKHRSNIARLIKKEEPSINIIGKIKEKLDGDSFSAKNKSASAETSDESAASDASAEMSGKSGASDVPTDAEGNEDAVSAELPMDAEETEKPEHPEEDASAGDAETNLTPVDEALDTAGEEALLGDDGDEVTQTTDTSALTDEVDVLAENSESTVEEADAVAEETESFTEENATSEVTEPIAEEETTTTNDSVLADEESATAEESESALEGTAISEESEPSADETATDEAPEEPKTDASELSSAETTGKAASMEATDMNEELVMPVMMEESEPATEHIDNTLRIIDEDDLDESIFEPLPEPKDYFADVTILSMKESDRRKIAVIDESPSGLALANRMVYQAHNCIFYVSDKTQLQRISETNQSPMLPDVILSSKLHYTANLKTALHNRDIIFINPKNAETWKSCCRMLPREVSTPLIIVGGADASIPSAVRKHKLIYIDELADAKKLAHNEAVTLTARTTTKKGEQALDQIRTFLRDDGFEIR